MPITDRIVVKDAAALSRRADRRIPRNAFHGATLDLLHEGAVFEQLDPDTADRLERFVTDFMGCGCDDEPFCGHPERRFVRHLLALRRDGLSPGAIVDSIERDYNLTAEEGDVLDFLDEAVRAAEAVADEADVLAADDVADDARRLRDDIVG